MTVHVAVMYEFDTRPQGARKALRAARQALRPIKWSSLNIVFLERLETGGLGAGTAHLEASRHE
jgi:hypothetical protein